MASTVFTEAWVQSLVAASAGREPVPGLDGIVGFGIGKKVHVVVEIVSGRAVGPSTVDPEVVVPFTGAQVQAWYDGELNLTESYTKGDLKATGKTGALLAAAELLDDRSVVAQLPGPAAN